MFGKLVKHELKSVGKWYIATYVGVVSLSIVLGLWIQNLAYREQNHPEVFDTGMRTEGILLGTSLLAYGFLLAALFLSTFILIINRFRKNVYGREGYLTLTLPVSSHHILLSKLISSFLWSTLASLTGFLSIIILGGMLASTENINIFVELTELAQNIDWSIAAQFLFQTTIDTINGILLIFLSLSIGQLFKDHRFLFAVLTYIGISIVIFCLSLTFSLNGFLATGTSMFNPAYALLSIVLSFAYYFGTYYILTKKLNLQ